MLLPGLSAKKRRPEVGKVKAATLSITVLAGALGCGILPSGSGAETGGLP